MWSSPVAAASSDLNSEMSTSLPPLRKIPPRASLHYTKRFSEEHLRAYRQEGDPAADSVVADLAKSSALTDIHDLLGVVKEKAVTEGGSYRAFVDQVNTIPAWADFDKMKRGQQIITAYLPFMGLSLGVGSLVAVGGGFPKMRDVVEATGMLTDGPKASALRLQRTTRFVMLLTTPGELLPEHGGHEAILRIRLLHGAVRSYVVERGVYKEEQEVPINQHDLAITLGLFGYIGVRNLRRMGIRLSHADVESYMLLWRYVGHILGICDDLLPKSFEDEQEFFLASTLMMGDQFKGESHKLAKAFAKIKEKEASGGSGRLSKWAQSIGPQLLLLFAGEDELAGFAEAGFDNVKGKPSGWWLTGLHACGRLANMVDQQLPFGSTFLSSANVALARWNQKKEREEDQNHMLRSKDEQKGKTCPFKAGQENEEDMLRSKL